MQGITVEDGALRLAEVADPSLKSGEVLIDVVAAGVNRADITQRRGASKPPEGASPILGLECSGTIARLGEKVTNFAVGDRVCALLDGGGYAQKVAVPAGQVLLAPENLPLVDAAALPETAATVWANLFRLAELKSGETVLIHGGGSGLGTMAIQMAVAFGAQVAVTAGRDEKLAVCRELGATILINYQNQDFVEVVRKVTKGIGVDVVLDIVGAAYAQRNIDVLSTGGRLLLVGILSGKHAQFDLSSIMRKRIHVVGSMLRSRTPDEKAQIVRGLAEHVLPLVENSSIIPRIHATMPLRDAGKAHSLIENSEQIGKILLTPGHS